MPMGATGAGERRGVRAPAVATPGKPNPTNFHNGAHHLSLCGRTRHHAAAACSSKLNPVSLSASLASQMQRIPNPFSSSAALTVEKTKRPILPSSVPFHALQETRGRTRLQTYDVGLAKLRVFQVFIFDKTHSASQKKLVAWREQKALAI